METLKFRHLWVTARNVADNHAESLKDCDQLEEAVEALDMLRQARQLLADLERLAEGRVAALMPYKEFTVGDYRLERRGGYKRTKWDVDGVLNKLTTRAVLPDTGEVVDALDLKALKAVASINYFRVTKLPEFGIDPDEFCTKEEGRPTVQVHSLALADQEPA